MAERTTALPDSFDSGHRLCLPRSMVEEIDTDMPDDAAWAAVERRDRRFDGRFVTGVLTTGVYCRPSCAARHPKRANVRFFATPEKAEAAGLRACFRCAPNDVARDEAAVEAVARTVVERIEAGERAPTLAELAGRSGYSPSHLQRVFKRATGLSPAAYARARKIQRAERTLCEGGSVTDAIQGAGFGSPSRYYDAIRQRKGGGMAHGARDDVEAIRWTVAATTLAPMLVAASAKGVCLIAFLNVSQARDSDAAEHMIAARFPMARRLPADPGFDALVAGIMGAVEEPGSRRNIPLDVRGTAFQEAVWSALREIPAGETRSYSELAAAIGRPKAVRAVGSANGANRLAVLIPCHRVVHHDGTVGGYAYGPDIKRALLDRERLGTI